MVKDGSRAYNPVIARRKKISTPMVTPTTAARLKPARLTRVSIVRLRSWESEELGSIGTPGS